MKRSSGVLLPVFCLPSKYGIGSFSKEAYEFVDWLAKSGQEYWQILPLGQTGYGDSPYQSFSSFAGNPYFISLEELEKEGLLKKEEYENEDFGESELCIDYGKLYLTRYKVLEKAYSRWEADKEYHMFAENNKGWLYDYALFMSVKEYFNNVSWLEWDEDIRNANEEAINIYSTKLNERIGFFEFVQYYFFKQWKKLKDYANNKNIKIIGDIPIYAAMDSVDVWKNRKLFQFDKKGMPEAVAGCPPDGFSEEGQLWGNPLYRWSIHRNDDYGWWVRRLKHSFLLYDVVRLDHFRGFDEYYSIPFGSVNAKKGHWEDGPGYEFFQKTEQALGRKEYIAEDLGFVTESVKELLKKCGFSGMKVLEFAFDERDTGCRNDYLPHNYEEMCVVYTGTHDNQTIVSWFCGINERERIKAREYLNDFYTPDKEIYKSFVSMAMRSKARLSIIPMQDLLGLDDKSRINIPSTLGNNWRWRMKKSDFSEELSEWLLNKTKMYDRV